MAEPYVGEIKLVPFTVVVPKGWQRCEGQLLQISQNTALFALLGTMYGGDGRQTFGLPDLRGRTPVGVGSTSLAPDPGVQGASAGAETVVLTVGQLPSHRHSLNAVTAAANEQLPTGNLIASGATDDQLLFAPATNLVTLHSGTIANQGGSVGHNNMQPYLVLQYIIATQGIFPSRN